MKYRIIRAFFLILPMIIGLNSESAARTVLVKGDLANLREGASGDSKKIATLSKFTLLEDLGSSNAEYLKVRTKSEQTGWVHRSLLSRSPFVTITGEKANVREGPGKDHAILWSLGRRYPLRVEDAKDDYLKVKDYEGDSGWVHKSLVEFEAYVIVKNGEANVRKGPGVDNPIAFKALKGVILKVKGEKNNWLEIRHQDGDEGWISRNLVWGYKDE